MGNSCKALIKNHTQPVWFFGSRYIEMMILTLENNTTVVIQQLHGLKINVGIKIRSMNSFGLQ